MNWFLLLCAAFATFRVARIIAEEDGPAFVFQRLRLRFNNQKQSFDVGIRCFYCVSVWVSFFVMLLLVLVAGWDVWLFPLWWFAIAGIAVKLYEFWGKR